MNLSYARVKRIIYDFDIRNVDEKEYKKGEWLLNYNYDVYIIEEPGFRTGKSKFFSCFNSE